MIMKMSIGIAALLALLITAGCKTTNNTNSAKDTTSGASKDPAIEIVQGGTATIELHDIAASTGYAWKYNVGDSAVVRVDLGERSRIIPDPKAISTYMQKYIITGISPGTSKIVFELKRGWEKDVPASEVKTYTVHVAKP